MQQPVTNRRGRGWHFNLTAAGLCLAAWALSSPAGAQWLQWGGPDRNFKVQTKGLAATWADEGPRRIWQRELGDGYASIVVDDGRLYTLYRTGEQEYSVALDARTGRTLWEHAAPSPITPSMAEFGPGPNSTPLIVGDRVFTIGAHVLLRAFDKQTGGVLWERDLIGEYNAPLPHRGYSCSPLAYGDTIILLVGGMGGAGHSVMALDQATGREVWRSLSFSTQTEYSSPILINLDGEDQLVLFRTPELFGLNPKDGKLLWTHPHAMRTGLNVSTPVWNGADLIFSSAAYDSGAQVVRLTRSAGQTKAEQVWFSRKMRLHHGNAVVLGDYVFGSCGDFGPAFFMGMNLKTGEVLWRERGFKKATCVYGDGKLIILDEDGELALATVSAEKLTVHSRCQVTERISWTVPTLVDTTLYVRDRKNIMALDLGEE